MENERTFTAFTGTKLLVSGPVGTMLPVVKSEFDRHPENLTLIFEDQTGRQVDFDLRGTLAEVLVRANPGAARSGPGRPKLGVISREVSLLPRHWEWLEQQPNGASAAIRRVIDDARKKEPSEQQAHLTMEAVSRFLSAMAGNFPGYEEATRALFRRDADRFEELIRDWPEDVRAHTRRLTGDVF